MGVLHLFSIKKCFIIKWTFLISCDDLYQGLVGGKKRMKLLRPRTQAQDVSESESAISCQWKQLQGVIQAKFGISNHLWEKAFAQVLLLTKNVNNKNPEINFANLKQCQYTWFLFQNKYFILLFVSYHPVNSLISLLLNFLENAVGRLLFSAFVLL